MTAFQYHIWTKLDGACMVGLMCVILVCVYVYDGTCAYWYMLVRVYVYVDAQVYVGTCVYLYMLVHAYVGICWYVYVHILVRVLIHVKKQVVAAN